MNEVVKQSGPPADATAAPGIDFDRYASQVLQRCDLLAECSDETARITRLFCSPAMARAHQLVGGWMQAAEMTVALDAAGNLRGRYVPAGSRQERRVIVGSHLDSVADAGRYDGVLGVLMGVAVVEAMRESAAALPFDLEVIAFSDEEGVRFGAPFIGSRLLAGKLDDALLALTDGDDVTVRQALARFGAPSLADAGGRFEPGEIIAYLEPHIEQGRQLELAGEALGVVSAIAGQTRLTLQWEGDGGHAGTWPMLQRRDPLVAAARWTAAVYELGRGTPGLVATVGRLDVDPNVPNCIPRRVRSSLDVRHADDAVRSDAVRRLIEAAEQFAAESTVAHSVALDHEHSAVALDAELTERLARAIAPGGAPAPRLVSGAGHDAGVMAGVAPTAMLFLRSPGGVSHHPDESVTHADVAAGLAALFRCIVSLAST